MNCEDTWLSAFGAVAIFLLGCYLLYKMVEITTKQWGRVAALEKANYSRQDDIKNIECSIRYLQRNQSNIYDRSNALEKKVVDLEHTRNSMRIQIASLEKEIGTLRNVVAVKDHGSPWSISGTNSVWSCPEDVTKKKPKRKRT